MDKPLTMGADALRLKHKLEYLDKLVTLHGQCKDVYNVFLDRLNLVCNSIEKDLGLTAENELCCFCGAREGFPHLFDCPEMDRIGHTPSP